jgi:pimeloyl-ACP methyl ester carboxylesterase
MKYILIHGMGNQSATWFYEATRGLPVRIKQNMIPFYWEDLRDEAKVAHWLPFVRNPLLHWFRVTDAYDALSDLLLISNVLKKVIWRLTNTINSIRGKEFTLIGHSLGSIIAYLFVVLPKKQGLDDDLPAVLVTLGSPLNRQPVKHRVLAWLSRWFMPVPVCHWVNVSGRFDLVTSWFGGGTIPQADENILVNQGHDLNKYLHAYFKEKTT